MKSRVARLAALFGFVLAIAVGVAPAAQDQSAPMSVASNCPWWGCVVN